MSIQAYYSAIVSDFVADDPTRILGVLTEQHRHAVDEDQRWAWQQQILILKDAIAAYPLARIFFELYIPRMGKRADAAFITHNLVFVLEFKVGAREHSSSAYDQVEDYALDLKNFHEGSHAVAIVPVLVSTAAPAIGEQAARFAEDLVAKPFGTNAAGLKALLESVCANHSFPLLDIQAWISKGYKPTPTIIQAAEVLYRTHDVADIRGNEAKENLAETSASVSAAIDSARSHRKKAICFVTGVPGSGKTLAGLNIATRRSEEHADEHAVFLSGNGPLVEVLREALARDESLRDRTSKKIARRKVQSFIQNIHHFRDEYLRNESAPAEKVVVFDEAQRAWTREQLAKFMQTKRGTFNFDKSEPEFLLSVMDRHPDWCTVVCLVGGGQEINTGEAGISEWISALETKFPEWKVYISPRMALPEYGSTVQVTRFLASPRVEKNEHLHLAVSMRSFRAEALSTFVRQLIDNEPEKARSTFAKSRLTIPSMSLATSR